ncbi:MAG: 6-pyruvoyltetrahydropterin/6-carboxytetrahydropterin synthase [Paraglaciecola psychrophila]
MNKHATIEIEKENLHFSAAHFTIFSAEERERLHGHNFHISATITAPVDDNGLCFNYQIAKQKLKVLCDSMDEYTLMPSLSPHLSIEEQEQHYLVEFNREKMYFLKPDVLLIPVRNISVEELAYYILQTLKHDGFVDSLGITYLEIKVSSGPGLWGSSNWTKA